MVDARSAKSMFADEIHAVVYSRAAEGDVSNGRFSINVPLPDH